MSLRLLQLENLAQIVAQSINLHNGNTGYGVFKGGIQKLERFLAKNQLTQRKLLNFEFWISCELSKIGHHFSNKKNKKLFYRKKCAPKLVFFNEKKIEKDLDDF